MKAIWKFEIPVKDELDIMMPEGAEILAFQSQKDKLYIWAIVELEVNFKARRFYVIGTGHEFEEVPGRYIGTAQIFDGGLVWHLFEEIKEGEK